MFRFRECEARPSPRRRSSAIRWVCSTPGCRYFFSDTQINVMIGNYRRGSAHITEKGLRRYCDDWEDLRNDRSV